MKTKILLPLMITFSWAWTQPQYNVLHKTFEKGRPFNLSYTMSAIALVESDLGKYLLNINADKSLDCGVFMVNTKTLSNNKWEQARICERLQRDYDFSFSVALERFKYFYNYWRDKGYSKGLAWKRAVCSYNSGWNWKKGLPYYKKVVKAIHKIRKFMISLG